MQPAKARCQLPILALDVMDDAASRPGEQSGHDEPHALARPRRREAENIFGAIVAQIRFAEPAEHTPFAHNHPRGVGFAPACPCPSTSCLGLLPFAAAPLRPHTAPYPVGDGSVQSAI